MGGLNGILDVAKRALSAQRAGIDVTSHNISNASTAGYTRQRLQLAATPPTREGFGYVGTGVAAIGVQRIRQSFVDQQIWNTNQFLSKSSTQENVLSQIEAAFNEPTDAGVGSLINSFFNSFQDLSLHPEDSSFRNAVVQKAGAMNDGFHRITSSLDQLKNDLVLDAQTKVDQINVLVREIYDTGKRITALEAGGLDANDMRDSRDGKIEELAKLANIKVSDDGQGGTLITLGTAFVEDKAGYSTLQVGVSGSQLQVTVSGTSSVVDISSGDLGGILETRNAQIPAYQSKLDSLASAIITSINAVHTTGYGLGTPPPTGNNFFTGVDARSVNVDPAIVANLNLVAASGDGAPGNNTIALALSAVSSQKVLSGGSTTIQQYYANLVSDIGSTIQTVRNTSESQTLVLKQLENQRDSISGVSIDEEMVQLLKFQNGFNAAAKVITTVNQMYQTMLGMVS
ncbi:MAG: flagellar hook-associated protein FlgK [Ignavibacteriales bacterium]|nr:flagellar hook-associated protein FlgK [Ignavibacteriales bacterium]